MAKAAQKFGTICSLSSSSTCSIEEVAQAQDAIRTSKNQSALRWFQLYVYKDKSITTSLVRRAEKNGYTALVVTVL